MVTAATVERLPLVGHYRDFHFRLSGRYQGLAYERQVKPRSHEMNADPQLTMRGPPFRGDLPHQVQGGVVGLACAHERDQLSTTLKHQTSSVGVLRIIRGALRLEVVVVSAFIP